MRLLTGIVSAAAVMGLVMSASAAEGSKKDKTEVKLKPNQVLVSVPGMT